MSAFGLSFSGWKTVWMENLLPLPVLVWQFLFQTSQRNDNENKEGGHFKPGKTLSKKKTRTAVAHIKLCEYFDKELQVPSIYISVHVCI